MSKIVQKGSAAEALTAFRRARPDLTTQRAVAESLHVKERLIRCWQSGTRGISDSARQRMLAQMGYLVVIRRRGGKTKRVITYYV